MHIFRPRHAGAVFEVGTLDNVGHFVPLFKTNGLIHAINAVCTLNGGNRTFEFYRLDDEISTNTRMTM